MKKIMFIISVLITVCSCNKSDVPDIWKQLEDKEQSEALELLCTQINRNISSMQVLVSALDSNDCVTNVIKMMDRGKDAGYMLTFAKHGSVPLYHDSKAFDTYTPAVAMKMNDDGTYCWTADGEWLRDEDWFRIPVPALAENGDAQKGVVPEVRIYEGYWYVSSDGGETWEQLGQVQNGNYGCTLFKTVDFSDEKHIIFTFADGTELRFPKYVHEVDIYDPWDGYLDPDVYEEQDIINLTNVLTANMNNCNLATRHIMEIAYNFWKRRGEFIYCSRTAQDYPWDYWSYVGFKDGNTGFTVGAGHGGYKRIDCSTFVHYVINGIDYYSTPYYNALEWTEVKQGALTTAGKETSSTDKTVCRTGKMYLRHGKKYITESANSTNRFTKIFGYDRTGKMVQNMTGSTSFVLASGVEYVRAEMKVSAAGNYTPAVKGESCARILKYLRIREDEVLPVHSECPMSNRYTHQMAKWFDNNGYGLEAYEDYNPLFWEDSDFEPGTVVFMGKTSSSSYKGITHVTLYIGSGYIIHSQAPRGLLGGEGIMIDSLRDMELRYSRPFCAAASPKYHTNFDEEKTNVGK